MGDIQHDKKIKKIIIVGASGHAAEIDDYIAHYNAIQKDAIDKIKIVGYLDDNASSFSNYKYSAPYLGNIRSHKIDDESEYLIAIANIKFRRPIIEMFLEKGAIFTSFIHPSAFVSRSAMIGTGVIIAPNANIGPNVKIGNFNLINSRASIGHDTMLGNYNFVSPNTCFSGFTKIGDENLFGINCATIPNISIGSRNKIAAGMIINKNVKDDSTVFHRFKEKVIIINK